MARLRLEKVLSELRTASGIGWGYVETGGGCTALESEVVNGRYYLITDSESPSVNEVEGSSYLRGISIETDCNWTIGTYLEGECEEESLTDYGGWWGLLVGVSNLNRS